MANGINIPGGIGPNQLGGVGVPAFNFPNGANMGNEFGGAAGNGFWAPGSGNAAQIFQDMLGANQGIPNMLMANQMNGYNQFGNNMQQAMGQMGAQNQANQNASMGITGLKAGLQGQRMGDLTSLMSQAGRYPIQAGLVSALGGLLGGGIGGIPGGLRGFASTNSPQAASLPTVPGAGQPGSFGATQSGLFQQLMGANPYGQFSGLAAGALANPADQIRQQQQLNLQAQMHRGPYGAAGAQAGQVNLASVF